MSIKRRKSTRPLGKMEYRRLFVIAVEGQKTEPQYFSIFKYNEVTTVNILKPDKKSAPRYVLKKMKQYIKDNNLKKSDEAWLVVDKDKWQNSELEELYKWSKQKDNYGFALSNPMFEYWLLLHFEEGKNISSAQNCLDRLRKYLPEYDKYIDTKKITSSNISHAILKAKSRDNPPCQDWPRSTGTTVYKLVEKLFNK